MKEIKKFKGDFVGVKLVGKRSVKRVVEEVKHLYESELNKKLNKNNKN